MSLDVCLKALTLAITGVLTAIDGARLASQIGSEVGTTATAMELEVIVATLLATQGFSVEKGAYGAPCSESFFLVESPAA